MKENKAPEKIYIHEASAPELTEKLPYHIEYIRTDTFIEKADKFISTFFHSEDTELIKSVLNEFHKHIKL